MLQVYTAVSTCRVSKFRVGLRGVEALIVSQLTGDILDPFKVSFNSNPSQKPTPELFAKQALCRAKLGPVWEFVKSTSMWPLRTSWVLKGSHYFQKTSRGC